MKAFEELLELRPRQLVQLQVYVVDSRSGTDPPPFRLAEEI